jgi:glycosyltransferase involved in cell wall biosynthesis
MNIAHVVPSFGIGGMEKVICSFINQTFSQYDHRILILDGRGDAKQWIDSNSVQEIHFFKGNSSIGYLRCLFQALKDLHPDVLMTYNWGGTDAIWLGKLAGIDKIIHSEHGLNFDETSKTLWKRDSFRFLVYRLASMLITVSHEFKNIIHRRYRIDERWIKIVANGVNADYYSPDFAERMRRRNELGFSDNDFVVIFSGRLDPVKNFDLLLSIFEYCHSVDQNMKLLIIGDGPERGRIEQLCSMKGIGRDVVLLGEKREVLPFLRVADVFLLTSFREQMPLTILEAMAVGLPVVASRVGEIPNMIVNGREGFLADIDEGPEKFALAVLRLRDSATLKAMGSAARARILAEFQESVMTAKYQAIIDSLCYKG